MDKCKPAKTTIALGTKLTKNDDEPAVNNTLYKQMVGSLMYLTATRPYLMYVVSLISIFMESPKDSHWNVGKKNTELCCRHTWIWPLVNSYTIQYSYRVH